jgi:chromosome segregation ATPase
VLVKDLETAQKALSAKQSARSVAEQILQQSKDVNAALSLKLDNVKTSLAITQDKLDRKSKALDSQMTHADEAELQLKSVEDKLKDCRGGSEGQRAATGIGSRSFGQARMVRQHDDFFSCGSYCGSIQESFAGFKHGDSAP